LYSRVRLKAVAPHGVGMQRLDDLGGTIRVVEQEDIPNH